MDATKTRVESGLSNAPCSEDLCLSAVVGHVVAQWLAGDEAGMHRATEHLNHCDVVLVQHEYGIFGGTDGSDVLLLLAALTVPVVVVLHTVRTTPTAHQRRVLEAVAAQSDAV